MLKQFRVYAQSMFETVTRSRSKLLQAGPPYPPGMDTLFLQIVYLEASAQNLQEGANFLSFYIDQSKIKQKRYRRLEADWSDISKPNKDVFPIIFSYYWNYLPTHFQDNYT